MLQTLPSKHNTAHLTTYKNKRNIKMTAGLTFQPLTVHAHPTRVGVHGQGTTVLWRQAGDHQRNAELITRNVFEFAKNESWKILVQLSTLPERTGTYTNQTRESSHKGFCKLPQCDLLSLLFNENLVGQTVNHYYKTSATRKHGKPAPRPIDLMSCIYPLIILPQTWICFVLNNVWG